MATIGLHIRDGIQRVTLKTMLESEGHAVRDDASDDHAEIVFCDPDSLSEISMIAQPVIVVTPAAEVAGAVHAMREGAWGYIMTPLMPQEAAMVVQRALRSGIPEEEDSLDRLPTMESVEFEHIRRALRLCNGNQARAARTLKIGRNTLWRKLKKMGQDSENG